MIQIQNLLKQSLSQMNESKFNIKLAESRNGQVVLSDNLECFRLEFGNFVLDKSYEDLNLFFEHIQTCMLHIFNRDYCPHQCIYFKTSNLNLRLRFSAYEVQELYELLQNSILKFELNV